MIKEICKDVLLGILIAVLSVFTIIFLILMCFMVPLAWGIDQLWYWSTPRDSEGRRIK